MTATKRYLLALVIVAGTLAASGPGDVGRAQVPVPPNFLVIVTDDQRADTMDAMPKTLSQFASHGTRFTNGFATTPLCCPSRASIFTGRYAHNHRVRTNEGPTKLDQETTVQYYLQNSGYRTAIFGKYLNGWKDDPPYFERWGVPKTRRYEGGVWNLGGDSTQVLEYSTTFIEALAVGFLNETESLDARPWLMFLTPQASHRPYTAEAGYEGAPVPRWDRPPSINEDDVSDKPPYIRRKPRIEMRAAKKVRQRQLRTLYSVDDMVEEMFTTLSDLGELENTYVFYLSDNGFAWGDHRLLVGGALKNTPYTSSIKVPFLVSGPSLAGGGEDPRLVANIDVAATMLDLAEVPTMPDPPLDGRSLVGEWSRDWILLEWWKARQKAGIPPWRSIRSQEAQYTEYVRRGDIRTLEYYDLTTDPFQLDNLMGDGVETNNPDTAALHDQLTEYFKCSGSTCP